MNIHISQAVLFAFATLCFILSSYNTPRENLAARWLVNGLAVMSLTFALGVL